MSTPAGPINIQSKEHVDALIADVKQRELESLDKDVIPELLRLLKVGNLKDDKIIIGILYVITVRHRFDSIKNKLNLFIELYEKYRR